MSECPDDYTVPMPAKWEVGARLVAHGRTFRVTEILATDDTSTSYLVVDEAFDDTPGWGDLIG